MNKRSINCKLTWGGLNLYNIIFYSIKDYEEVGSINLFPFFHSLFHSFKEGDTI